MPINMPDEPLWRTALRQATEMKQREQWVHNNQQVIIDSHVTLGFPPPTSAQLDEIARQTTDAYETMVKRVDAAEWVREFESYHGKDSFQPKHKKGDLKSKQAATMAFVGDIQARFDNDISRFREVNNARRRVDLEDKELVNRVGRQRLINAELGIEGSGKHKQRFDFLKDLDPVFQREFGRVASVADVDRIMDRHQTVDDYDAWLKGMQKVERLDLGNFGVRGVSPEQLQQGAKPGKAADLTARIEEARVRRLNLHKPGASQIATAQTAGGLVQEDLF